MISFAPLRKILSERKISTQGTCFEARSDVGIRNLLTANLHENA